MRPYKQTPVHKTDLLAELVCSNSLGAKALHTAKGVLQRELELAGSLVMEAARESAVDAGGALAVDRRLFSAYVTEAILSHDNITVERREAEALPEDVACVLATGPLTSSAMEGFLSSVVGSFLHYYDAVAPIVLADTIDRSVVFEAGRYGQSPDYLNCPLTEEEYRRLWERLNRAERHQGHDVDDLRYFEGCLPIEELARRDYLAMAYGPLKPVGLIDPKTGKRPFAVVQLRSENRLKTMYGLVGFQTGLRFGEQKEIVRMIPGLENAEIVRYGVIHRNTYLDSPKVLLPGLRMRGLPNVFVAGVLCGVEGYLESAATGLVCGLNAARMVSGLGPVVPPSESMTGALVRHVCEYDGPDFQPMPANFGLLPPVGGVRGRARRELMAQRALEAFERWVKAVT